MNNYKQSIILVFIGLLMTILACTINIGGPEYPSQSIPVSTEAVGELQKNIQTAVVGGLESGTITLVLTESQLSSYLSFKLQAETDPIISNPQVYLHNSQIEIYGTAQKSFFVATVSIVLTPSVNEQGQLEIELITADFGPLPVPDDLKNAITSIVTEAYTGSLGPIVTRFELESVAIDYGMMILTGHIR